MSDRENVREFDVYEYQIHQLMPADGYLVVYANQLGKTFTQPVAAWGLVDERVQPRVCYKANGRHHAENMGKAVVNRKIVPLVLYHDDGELKPVNSASNFLGVCRVGDNPREVFADELETYLADSQPSP
ncbi:MAG: hypothetical protein ACYC4B_11655 [Pirellulaceae bacterium]